MAELKTRISLKYDILEHWQKSTLGLNKGELAIVEIPTADPENKQLPPVMFKVGVDGIKTFKELNWASALAADVYGWAKQSGITVGTSGTGNVVTGLSWDSANDRLLITKGDYVPSTRKVNNRALSADITLGAADVGVTETAFPGLNKVGTVTGVKMNDAAKTVGADGVVNLGTVLTEHQTIAEGAANGTISVAGTDVKVHGLGSAAYKAEGAFDAAGSATTAANGVLGHSTDDATANTVYGAKAAAKAAQDTIDNYKTSNDAALAGVKATAEAAQTSAQVDAKISTHNTSAAAHNDIRQSMETIKQGTEFMKMGHSMVLFPEGTRNQKDTLLPFKEGGLDERVVREPAVDALLVAPDRHQRDAVRVRIRLADLEVRVPRAGLQLHAGLRLDAAERRALLAGGQLVGVHRLVIGRRRHRRRQNA